MPEKETVFSSKIKYNGIFSFQEFYRFCYDWLKDEIGLDINEDKYSEKLSGNEKNIEVKWTANKKITDYFKYEFEVTMQIIGLVKVEIQQDGKKIKTNSGSIEVKMKGNLVRDYKGNFETNALNKLFRGIYDKVLIKSKVEKYQDKLAEECNEFLYQAKAYLDLEGKK